MLVLLVFFFIGMWCVELSPGIAIGRSHGTPTSMQLFAVASATLLFEIRFSAPDQNARISISCSMVFCCSSIGGLTALRSSGGQ